MSHLGQGGIEEASLKGSCEGLQSRVVEQLETCQNSVNDLTDYVCYEKE
jgi:hypothetical protein